MTLVFPDRASSLIMRCQHEFCTVHADRRLSDVHVIVKESMHGRWMHGVKVACPYHAPTISEWYQPNIERFIRALMQIGGT